MQWTIVEQADGSWAVVDDTGKVIVGSQPTREDAVSRLGELAASALGELPAGGIASGRGARFRMRYMEGERTSDGRVIDPMATQFNREPPLPLMLSTETSEGHLGAQLSGVIDTAYRDSTMVIAEGNFDAGSEAGREHQRLVEGGILTTWSPDIGDAEIRMEQLDPSDGEDDDILGLLLGLGETLMHLTSGTLLGGTGVPFPALASARIETMLPGMAASVTAGGFPYVRGTGTIEIIEEGAPLVASADEPCEDCVKDEGTELTFLAFEERALHFGSTGGSVSNAAWDGAAGRFTDDQYKFAAAACDGKDSDHPKTDCFLPHHEPGGAINRNGVHAAAQRVSALKGHSADAVSQAKAHLRSHYQKDLKEDVPDSLTAAGLAQGGIVEGRPFLVGETDPEEARLPASTVIVNEVHGDPQQTASRVAAALRDRESPLLRPPAEWFADPELNAPTALTVTSEGRIFGHLAQWGVCHTGILDRCVLAPHSRSGYAYFQQGSVVTDDGERRRCGKLTVGCGHAKLTLDADSARAHYDGGPGAYVGAHVVSGEDEHGIWFSGCVDPRLDDFQRWELETMAVSGDWRTLGGSLELIACLSVPVPGFPILADGLQADAGVPRPELAMERGEVMAIVAAGVLLPRRVALAMEVAGLRRENVELRGRLDTLEARLETRTEPLLASAAKRLHGRLRGE